MSTQKMSTPLKTQKMSTSYKIQKMSTQNVYLHILHILLLYLLLFNK